MTQTSPARAIAATAGRVLAVSGVDVVYRLFVSSSLNVAAGTVAAVTVDITTKAIVEPVSVREILSGGSTLQVGDVRITLALSAVASALATPGRTVSVSDRVVVDGISYRLIAFDMAANGTLLRVVARR